MAGHWQGVPFRVLAPHRWALLKSPTALLLLSHPCRRRWDVPRIFWLLIFPSIPDAAIHAPRQHRLTTTRLETSTCCTTTTCLPPVRILCKVSTPDWNQGSKGPSEQRRRESNPYLPGRLQQHGGRRQVVRCVGLASAGPEIADGGGIGMCKRLDCNRIGLGKPLLVIAI
jgi:hypothetical protein